MNFTEMLEAMQERNSPSLAPIQERLNAYKYLIDNSLRLYHDKMNGSREHDALAFDVQVFPDKDCFQGHIESKQNDSPVLKADIHFTYSKEGKFALMLFDESYGMMSSVAEKENLPLLSVLAAEEAFRDICERCNIQFAVDRYPKWLPTLSFDSFDDLDKFEICKTGDDSVGFEIRLANSGDFARAFSFRAMMTEIEMFPKFTAESEYDYQTAEMFNIRLQQLNGEAILRIEESGGEARAVFETNFPRVSVPLPLVAAEQEALNELVDDLKRTYEKELKAAKKKETERGI